MENRNNLSPQESILIISEAIAKTKENIAKNSFSFLLWGWLIATASFGFFILQQYTSFAYYFIPFPLAAAVGIVLTLIHYIQRSHTTTETYTDYFLSKMWMTLGLGFILVVFVNVSSGNTPFTYTLIMAGLGTLISGWVLQFKPLLAGGGLLLISAIVSIYTPVEYKALLHGLAIVGGYIIPGYLLKNAKA